MDIKEVINNDCIDLDLKSVNKKNVLEALTDLLYKSDVIDNKEGFLKDVYIREDIGSTGIGNYIAIPHGKSKYVKKVALAIGKTKFDIDWDSLDGLPVRFFVLYAVPENEELHNTVQIISYISSKLGDDDVCKKLLESQSKEEIFEVFN